MTNQSVEAELARYETEELLVHSCTCGRKTSVRTEHDQMCLHVIDHLLAPVGAIVAQAVQQVRDADDAAFKRALAAGLDANKDHGVYQLSREDRRVIEEKASAFWQDYREGGQRQ